MADITLTERIIADDGLKPEDLSLTENEYEEHINYFINAVKAWINRYTKVIYTDTLTYPIYPIDLELMVYNIVIRLLSNQTIQQDMPVVDNENYKVMYFINKVITSDDKAMLGPFMRKLRPKIISVGGSEG